MSDKDALMKIDPVCPVCGRRALLVDVVKMVGSPLRWEVDPDGSLDDLRSWVLCRCMANCGWQGVTKLARHIPTMSL